MLEQTNWEREQSDAVVGTRLAELEAENRELRKHYTLRGGAQSLFYLMRKLDEATIQRSGFEEWRHIGRNQPRVFAVGSGGEGEEGTLVDRRLMASLWLSYFETKGKRKQ